MIYFVRHGQTDWNLQCKIQGVTDIPLNAMGMMQAMAVANQLNGIHFDKVFCSPLKRALQTCQIICANDSITVDDRIIERAFGKFEGLTMAQCDFKSFWEVNKILDTGESLSTVIQRVFSFLEEITQKYRDKQVLIVSHGGVGMVMKSYFEGIPTDGNYMQYLPPNGKVVLFPC